MDLENYWQENRRFVLQVAGGALVFLILFLWVGNAFGADFDRAKGGLNGVRAALARDAYSRSERDAAHDENQALVSASAALREAVAFRPRPQFTLQDELGDANIQYYGRVSRMQNELGVLASRARIVLPENLDLEDIKTNDVALIERQLEALDMLDRLVRSGIEAGIDRVVSIDIDLDPALSSRDGVGAIERTRVRIKLTSKPHAAGRFLALTQSDQHGQPALVDTYDVKRAGGGRDEVTLEATFLVVRLHDVSEEEA